MRPPRRIEESMGVYRPAQRMSSDPITGYLRMIWFVDIISSLFMAAIPFVLLALAAHYGPRIMGFIQELDDMDVPAELPATWPLDEVTLPAGALRTQLPNGYWRFKPVYYIDGERWQDPVNYGKVPLRWVVAFCSDNPPETVYNHYVQSLKWPLYRPRSVDRLPLETRLVYDYCDGDTFISITGPGPYDQGRRYIVTILMYDN
ncbi:hypothetical protein JW859_11690 [bacterium]|nr:hypothetical protein [bacterium]